MQALMRYAARPRLARALVLAAALHAVGDPATAATSFLEAEAGEVVRGRTQRAHAGATGTGYVNYGNESGSYVAWVLEVSQAASDHELRFRYANGAATDRPMKVIVNDRNVGTFLFPPTGSWSTWRTSRVPDQALRKGLNTVRAEAVGAAGGPNLDRLVIEGGSRIALTDWAQALIYSTTGRCRADAIACVQQDARFPDPAQLGPDVGGTYFGYTQGLTLLGIHQSFLRDRAKFAQYLDYIEAWFDARTDGDGRITRTRDPQLRSLDTIMPGRAALLLHAEGTPENRYKRTADILWRALETHGRTPGGSVAGWPDARIFWHADNQKDFVLLDGAYMALPFAVLYGDKYDRHLPGFPSIYKDVAGQLLGHRYHLQDIAGSEIAASTNTKLFYHGYDRQGDGKTESLDWTTGSNRHSNVFWGRAMGWYAMTLVDVLDRFPTDAAHAAHRKELIGTLDSLLEGLRAKQRSDGLWNTVIHHPTTVIDNFAETSSTAMFVYAMSKAISKGYIAPSYAKVASKAYQGVLSRISLTRRSPHLATLAGTAEGQSVQLDNLTRSAAPKGAELYTTSTNEQGRITPDRRRNPVDDKLHGIGSFLLMYEQVRSNPSTISPF